MLFTFMSNFEKRNHMNDDSMNQQEPIEAAPKIVTGEHREEMAKQVIPKLNQKLNDDLTFQYKSNNSIVSESNAVPNLEVAIQSKL